MKRLPLVILAFWMLLVVVVTGCGRTPRYDGRLVAADSLMRTAPDSVLAIVEAICRDSLTSEGDRAYHDLLLTQSRYRCYVTATSDSDINRALAYYRAHSSECEKLTRAYIYKGAVMDELGHPDSAMLYYKHAEAVADTTDYFNLGYIKKRIATLYQDQLSQDTSAITCLKEAINCFSKVKDTSFLISCYGDLGAICGVRYSDSTEYYLNRAIELAKSNNPEKQYTYKSKLAGFNLYHKKDFRKANSLSMDVLKNGTRFCDENQFYYYAVLSYIKLGLLDSARYVFSITPPPNDYVDSMNYYSIIAEFEKINDNPKLYAKSAIKSSFYENKIISGSQEKQLLASEIEFQRQQVENVNVKLVRQNDNLLIILLIIMLSTVLLVLFLRKYQNHLKHQLYELENQCDELEVSLANLKRQKETNSNDITRYVGYRISAMYELYDKIRVKRDAASNQKKSVIPLSVFLKELNDRNQLLDTELSESFWKKMIMSVDGEYNGIVTFVEKCYPELTEKDIKLFCLLCANISPQIIKLCMNYTSDKTPSTYRNRIIQKKMGLDMTFDEFVSNYMKGTLKDMV